jgi:hypothetical protein
MSASLENVQPRMMGSVQPAVSYPPDLHSSGVSWGAALAGASVMAALSLILIALGAGFGLSVVSPWSSSTSYSAAGAGAIVWLIVTVVLASAMGGYLAGRLRTRWISLHTDEVHFRDTANGLLSWAVGVVVTVAFLASAAMSMAGNPSGPAETSFASGGMVLSESPRLAESNSYFVDRLLQSDRPIDLVTQVEATRVFDHAVRFREASPEDYAYLSQLVSARTGLVRDAADARVSDTVAAARENRDATRKTVAHILLWTFVALLLGAFCASYAATIGGRQRDHVRTAA